MKKNICFKYLISLSFIFSNSILIALDSNLLIITELMVDPLPSLGLPSEEYIEVFNNGNDEINLENYSLSDEKTVVSLSGSIAPKSYLILSHEDDTSLFIQYGKVIGLKKWPSLNNDQDKISLLDGTEIIFQLNYDLSLLSNIQDQDGGYALELKEMKTDIDFQYDYHFSTDPSGGTPGRENSLQTLEYVDQKFDLIWETKILEQLYFDFEFEAKNQGLLYLHLYDQQGRYIANLLTTERVYGRQTFHVDIHTLVLLNSTIYVLSFQASDELGSFFRKNESFYLNIKDL